MDVCSLSAVEMLEKLDTKEVSSRELVDAHIERIEKLDFRINSIVHRFFSAARQAADESDARRAKGKSRKKRPLDGLPFTLKESLSTPNTPVSLGVPNWRHRLPNDEAVVGTLLEEAGGVCIGKTNVSQMLLFHESDNPVFGRCNNPFALDRVPGGSSGGEAAAIAAGLSPGGVGTDIGGSIRVPAAFCGIAGIKPTVDRWSNIGSNSAIPGQEVIRSQCGPMARTTADVALLLRAIDNPRHSVLDPLVNPMPIGDPSKVKAKKLRVGFYFDDGFINASPAVQRAVIEACDVLSDAGVHVVGIEAQCQRELLRVYLSALSADGAWHLDHAMNGEGVMPQLRPLKAVVQLPQALRRAALRGLELLGEDKAKLLVESVHEKTVAELWQLTNKRTQIRRQVMDYWRDMELDAVVCPAHATPALGHGHSNDFTLAGSYSIRYNFLNLPAGVVPVTRVLPNEEGRAETRQRIDKKAALVQQGSSGLPIGVQVVARPYREDVVLSLMQLIEDGVKGRELYPTTPVELSRN